MSSTPIFDAAGTARGALGLSVAPDDTEIASAALRGILQRIERDGQARHWRFVFPHNAGL